MRAVIELNFFQKKSINLSRVLFLSFVLFISVAASAAGDEDPKDLSPKARLELADRYFAESVFYSAAENYKAYLDKKPDDRYANYWYAMALYYARDYENSSKAFSRFYALQPTDKDNKKDWVLADETEFKLGRLIYAQVLHRLGECEDAKSQASKFRATYKTDDKDEEDKLLSMARVVSQSCDTIGNMLTAKASFSRLPNTVNHAYSETSPVLFSDRELYYTSTGSDDLVEYKGYKNKHFYSIYKSTYDGKTWSKGKKVSETINESGYHTSNGTFNKDRSRFYFTKCLEVDDDRPLCNIFVSEVKGGKFGKPTRLPEGINFKELYTATNPTVRATESKRVEYLYFVSDRPGGIGGTDVWVTKRNQKGEYSEPELARGLNSKGNEITPFYDDSLKQMYLASDGIPGFGGFDIFVAKLPEGTGQRFDKPKNMGKPINTGADDFGYTVSSDCFHGFFCSNREGSVPLNGIVTASDDIYGWVGYRYAIKGKVIRKGTTDSYIENAYLNMSKSNEEGVMEPAAFDSSSFVGSYFFTLQSNQDYFIDVNKDCYSSDSFSFSTKYTDKDDTIIHNFYLDRIAYIVFGDIIEQYSGGKLIPGAEMFIYELLPNGTEQLFTQFTNGDSVTSYAVKLPIDKNFKLMARKDGYFAGYNNVSTRAVQDGDSIRADVKMRSVQMFTAFKLENILYDYAQATLTDVAKESLDSLYTILAENPTMHIQLSSHTDSIGKETANLLLSLARAQSCVDYLVSKGIERRRLSAVGYGELRPVAPNSTPDGKDNPEGRTLNRRTEFRIVRM